MEASAPALARPVKYDLPGIRERMRKRLGEMKEVGGWISLESNLDLCRFTGGTRATRTGRVTTWWRARGRSTGRRRRSVAWGLVPAGSS